MSASYVLTAMFDNCVPQRQLDGCSVTRPFLSAKGVTCETKDLHCWALACEQQYSVYSVSLKDCCGIKSIHMI